ncbi:hypothetical protein LAZ67_12003576 [Cordylochernes scorpioides]|uniref:Uncharacterized protein n=1 Tax=Cordylochernes scorpioides TaxID=51811 RepID=A0ABY6L2F8_9ARAC|nr:hypothetical protein LAZ67_12003576 [Cordylochernes scorpioides]
MAVPGETDIVAVYKTNCDDHTLLQRAGTGTKLHYTHGQWTASATAERQPDYACANIQTLATHAQDTYPTPPLPVPSPDEKGGVGAVTSSLKNLGSAVPADSTLRKLMRVIVVYDDHALVDRTCQKWFARCNINAKGTRKNIWSHSTSHLNPLKRNWNDPKGRKLGAFRETSNAVFHVKNCSNVQKKKKNERKGFLHQIVTGDEKWVNYDYSKRWATYEYPGRVSSSTAKLNIHGGKIMLCIWWDQLGVAYYELLQPNERITGDVY